MILTDGQFKEMVDGLAEREARIKELEGERRVWDALRQIDEDDIEPTLIFTVSTLNTQLATANATLAKLREASREIQDWLSNWTLPMEDDPDWDEVVDRLAAALAAADAKGGAL